MRIGLLLLLALAAPSLYAQVEKAGIAGLSADSTGPDLAVGSAVTVRVYVEEALDANTGWALAHKDHNGWVDLDSVLLEKNSLKIATEENGSTRFDITGILAKPGAGEIKDLLIANENGSVQIRAQGKLAEAGSLLSEEEKKQPPEWILPPVTYGGWNRWFLGLGALLLTGALAFAGRWIWRRWQRAADEGLTYFERATRDLRSLDGQIKKADRETQRRIGYALSRIMREFSEARFGISATEMTDQEFLRAMTSLPVKKRFANLDDSFANLDLLRFSKVDPDPTVAAKLLVEVREFVLGNPPPLEEKKK